MNKIFLNKVMNKKNITVYRLAKMTDISSGRMFDIVKGKTTNPRLDTIIKIAKALELDSNEFIILCNFNSMNQL